MVLLSNRIYRRSSAPVTTAARQNAGTAAICMLQFTSYFLPPDPETFTSMVSVPVLCLLQSDPEF
jgi:hypothetical protein